MNTTTIDIQVFKRFNPSLDLDDKFLFSIPVSASTSDAFSAINTVRSRLADMYHMSLAETYFYFSVFA